jgi:hypothetical protein
MKSMRHKLSIYFDSTEDDAESIKCFDILQQYFLLVKKVSDRVWIAVDLRSGQFYILCNFINLENFRTELSSCLLETGVAPFKEYYYDYIQANTRHKTYHGILYKMDSLNLLKEVLDQEKVKLEDSTYLNTNKYLYLVHNIIQRSRLPPNILILKLNNFHNIFFE